MGRQFVTDWQCANGWEAKIPRQMDFMLGLDTFFFLIFLSLFYSFIFFHAEEFWNRGLTWGASSNNRQQQHSSYLANSLLCGSALEKGRRGGALRAFWFYDSCLYELMV